MTQTGTNFSFDGLGIAPKVLGLLDRLRFRVPTPIQHKVIPIAMEGKDVIGVAQTGTGKTLAFAIPIAQQLPQKRKRCLVLVPTRELAIQVNQAFQKFAQLFGLHTVVIIGGASMRDQLRKLRRNPHIIIATPGRLADHLQQRTVRLSNVGVLVLDEADRMLDMGFKPQIEDIIKHIPKDRQTMLFSATIPGDVIRIATVHMKLPVHIEVAPSGTMAEKITQELFIVKRDAKRKLLSKILKQYHGPVLLFARTKVNARQITSFLRGINCNAAEIHSDRSLAQRRQALEGFKSGRYRVLVATDIASRGIDVVGIELVINYDLPDDTESYVHRIGRTARAGHEGRAISFATPQQGSDVRNIERLIKTALPISEHPDLPKERFVQPVSRSHRTSFHGGPKRRHGRSRFRRRR
ncbi:MAG: DEAD/DEAH box helicase [Candidatus Omnitrophica bacterium]|nr:DEAD/DEAH box helicase [Candidatus Omnitrophota bacterium]